MLASSVDEEVVEIARTLREKAGNVYLLTTDRAQMAVAENVGVESCKVLEGKNIINSRGKLVLAYLLFPITIPYLFIKLFLLGKPNYFLVPFEFTRKDSNWRPYPGNPFCPPIQEGD